MEVSLKVRIWGLGVLVLVFGLGFKFRVWGIYDPCDNTCKIHPAGEESSSLRCSSAFGSCLGRWVQTLR